MRSLDVVTFGSAILRMSSEKTIDVELMNWLARTLRADVVKISAVSNANVIQHARCFCVEELMRRQASGTEFEVVQQLRKAIW